MDVSADSYWRSDGLDVRLIHQNLLGLLTESLDTLFGEGFAIEESSDLLLKTLDVANRLNWGWTPGGNFLHI